MPLNRKNANKGKVSFGNKNIDTHPKNQRHNKVKVNVEHSREAKNKAHSIVLSLIETGMTEDYLQNKIPYISPENYEDVVYERAITGICGYPLCNSVIIQTFGNQTYIIRQNKVYDITQRRNYCSNVCYEASELVLAQVPKVPLYLRATDKDLQNFKMTLPDVSALKGRYGKFVNIRGTDYDWEENLLKEEAKQAKKRSPKAAENSGDTINDSSNLISDDSSLNLSSVEGNVSMKTSPSSNESGLLSVSTDTARDSSRMSLDSDAYLSEEGKKLSLNDNAHDEENDEISKRLAFKSDVPVLRSDGKRTRSSVHHFGQPSGADRPLTRENYALESIYEVERALREWMTFEALRMILGDNYVRGMLEELGKTWEDYDTTAGLRLGVESKSKYLSLCKKLDAEEMKEKMLESRARLEEEGEEAKTDSLELKAMPNYEQLRKDARHCALNVTAFYEGREEVVESVENLQTIPEEGEGGGEEVCKKAKRKEKTSDREKRKTTSNREEEGEETSSLPLIDIYSQNTWRRQIVFDRLGNTLSCHVREFGLDEAEVRRLVVSLVATFDLAPHNITFEIRQWKLIGLVFLKMLSVRYPVIEETISPGGRGYEFITSYLEQEGLDSHYLSRLLSYLTEISYILTKYHSETNTTYPNHAAPPPTTISATTDSSMVPQQEVAVVKEVLESKDVPATQDLSSVQLSKKETRNTEGGRESTNYEELD